MPVAWRNIFASTARGQAIARAGALPLHPSFPLMSFATQDRASDLIACPRNGSTALCFTLGSGDTLRPNQEDEREGEGG